LAGIPKRYPGAQLSPTLDWSRQKVVGEAKKVEGRSEQVDVDLSSQLQDPVSVRADVAQLIFVFAEKDRHNFNTMKAPTDDTYRGLITGIIPSSK
jgi:hypothetical protein